MSHLYPLFFKPIYKEAIWGADRIFTEFQRTKTCDKLAESWEITDRKEGQSIVINGPLKGKSLHELIEEYGQRLMGKNKDFDHFPLLIKIIDANKPLSLQVHPDDHIAEILNEEAKTEAWVVLDTIDPSYIYANFKKETSKEEFAKAVKETKVETLVNKIQVQKDDVVFIPGRTIHAIDTGCLIFEVQQSSNTTFRVYDWDRKDEKGNRRQLHLDQALKTINFQSTNNPIVEPEIIEDNPKYRVNKLLQNPYFSLEKIDVISSYEKTFNGDSFSVYFCCEGVLGITSAGLTEKFSKGSTVFIPAEVDKVHFEKIQGPCKLLRIFLEDHK